MTKRWEKEKLDTTKWRKTNPGNCMTKIPSSRWPRYRKSEWTRDKVANGGDTKWGVTRTTINRYNVRQPKIWGEYWMTKIPTYTPRGYWMTKKPVGQQRETGYSGIYMRSKWPSIILFFIKFTAMENSLGGDGKNFLMSSAQLYPLT
jgi:hypothetical protein